MLEAEANVETQYFKSCQDELLLIEIQNENDFTVEWSNGEIGNQVEIQNGGNYWVEISNECSMNRYDFFVEEESAASLDRIFVPNAFSPNGDGINDRFQVFAGIELSEFDLQLFDRWGTKVFHSTSIEDCLLYTSDAADE